MLSPIGIFDSGLGGLTVVKEVSALLPDENLIYLGDTARVPYGSRSKEVIARYTEEDARFLSNFNVKLIVIACNSAAASADIDAMMNRFSIPIITVIEPGVKAALLATNNNKIGVVGTSATINSKAYEKAIHKSNGSIEVSQVAAPLFVPLAEEGFAEHTITRQVAEEYLPPLKNAGVDTLVLGCTHYPLLKNTLQTVMGESVTLIDSAKEVAKAIEDNLKTNDKLNTQNKGRSEERRVGKECRSRGSPYH